MPGEVYPFVVRLVAARVPDGGQVLEVGCGAMQYAPLLPGEYSGLDLPGSRYVEKEPDYVGTAEEIPVPDESFDVVFGVATFYYMDDVDRAFAECRRVLRPGGRLIVFDYRRAVIEKLRAEGDHAVRHAWDPPELRERLERAGFARRSLRDLSHRAVADEADSPLRRPVRRVRQKVSPERTQWLIVEAQRRP